MFEKIEQHAKGNLLEVYKLIHKGHGKEVTFPEFRTMADEKFNLGLSEAEYATLFAELDSTNSGKLQLDELMNAFAPAFAAPKMTSFDVVRCVLIRVLTAARVIAHAPVWTLSLVPSGGRGQAGHGRGAEA